MQTPCLSAADTRGILLALIDQPHESSVRLDHLREQRARQLALRRPIPFGFRHSSVSVMTKHRAQLACERRAARSATPGRVSHQQRCVPQVSRQDLPRLLNTLKLSRPSSAPRVVSKPTVSHQGIYVNAGPRATDGLGRNLAGLALVLLHT